MQQPSTHSTDNTVKPHFIIYPKRRSVWYISADGELTFHCGERPYNKSRQQQLKKPAQK